MSILKVRDLEKEHAIVEAVLYALRQGCFFPLPMPSGKNITVMNLRRWGALKNLHNKVAALGHD